jgi:hypothetical protein
MPNLKNKEIFTEIFKRKTPATHKCKHMKITSDFSAQTKKPGSMEQYNSSFESE